MASQSSLFRRWLTSEAQRSPTARIKSNEFHSPRLIFQCRKQPPFVAIIAKANILRSHHPAYRNDRARRLAFCTILREAFGITDEAALAQAFCRACVGREDVNGEHDLQQALAWAGSASPSARSFSPRKSLCDASAALHSVNDTETAGRAARLAMAFLELETNAA
jgi:hypothetical protein